MIHLVDPVSEIAKLEGDVNCRQQTLARMKCLFAKLPDLIVRKTPTDYEMCSPTMNGVMDKYTIVVSDKHEVEILPYTTCESHIVCSFPSKFTIGYENIECGFGIIPVQDWEQHMEDNGIGLSFILKTRRYLSSKPPISYIDDIEIIEDTVS